MRFGFHVSTDLAKKVAVVVAVLAVIAVGLLAIGYYEPAVVIDDAGSSPTADANENQSVEDVSGDLHRVDDNIEAILLLGIDKYSKDAQSASR